MLTYLLTAELTTVEQKCIRHNIQTKGRLPLFSGGLLASVFTVQLLNLYSASVFTVQLLNLYSANSASSLKLKYKSGQFWSMVYTSAFTVKAAEPLYSYQKHKFEANQDQNNELVSRDLV